jgi:hypothetical protein
MSTSAVSSTPMNQQLQQYFQTRQSDLRQLGQALSSGDLAGAQTAYNKIVSLGQHGPFAGGNPFKINQREQDFAAIGQALQSGDLAGAKQAFSALRITFENPRPVSTSPSTSGPEIVLNLSNNSGSTSPEQVTINISNPVNGGGEQVSLSVGNQGSNAQQVTFNLSPNSNEQIVLNVLEGSSSTSGSSSGSASGSSASRGLSVSA